MTTTERNPLNPFINPDPSGTILNFRIATPLPRDRALEWRDDMTGHLAGLGMQLVLTDCGTDIYLTATQPVPADTAPMLTRDDLLLIWGGFDTWGARPELTLLRRKIIGLMALDRGTVTWWADRILAKIVEDMAEPFAWGKQIPPWISHFAELYDVCDANDYLDELPWEGSGDGSATDPGLGLIRAVTAEISAQMMTRFAETRARMADDILLAINTGWATNCEVGLGAMRAVTAAFGDGTAWDVEYGGHTYGRREIDDLASAWHDWSMGWQIGQAPPLRMTELGHAPIWDPPAAMTAARRWTCSRCGSAALDYQTNVYGDAINTQCPAATP